MNTYSLDLELSSTQYAYIADGSQTGLDITGDLTIEFWLKIEQLPSTPASAFSIVTKYDTGANQRAYMVEAHGVDDKLRLYTADQGAGGGENSVTVLNNTALAGGDIGVWKQFAVTFDISDESGIWYVNGSPVSTSSIGTMGATLHNSTAAFAIGARYNSGSAVNFADSMIDEVRVYNVIRTPEEIAAYYKQGIAPTTTGLVGYWKLENNYLDETSNDNDLTASGSPVFSTDVPFTESSLLPFL